MGVGGVNFLDGNRCDRCGFGGVAIVGLVVVGSGERGC